VANPATLKSLLDGVSARFDGSPFTDKSFITQVQVVGWINDALAELDDILAKKFEDHRVSKTNVTLVVNTEDYALPTDFYRLKAVFLLFSAGVGQTQRMELKRFSLRQLDALSWSLISKRNLLLTYRVMGNKIYFEPTPQQVNTVEVWYLPQRTKLALGQATNTVGSGANGVVTVMHPGGSCGNAWTVTVVLGSGNNLPLSVSLAYPAITVTLGTDGSGVADATKNSAAQVASILNTVGSGLTATASGTGVTQIPVTALKQLSGGDDGQNSTIDVSVITGWEKYVMAEAASRCLAKQGRDQSSCMAEKAECTARVNEAAMHRDEGQANRVIDARGTNWAYDVVDDELYYP